MTAQAQTNPGKRIVIVIFACLIGLMAGLIYTWSIWVRPICEEYGWGTDLVALMGNVMLITFVFGVTLGGQMLPKLGARTSCLIGTIAFGGFFLLSAFVTNPILMYVTYGGVAGLGVGILYVVCQFAASAWFPDHRGLVMGIFLAVFGLSVTICSAPIHGILNSVGVRGTMLIVGGVITAVCLIGSLFMQTPPPGWTPAGMKKTENVQAAAEVKSLTVGEAVKTKDFWFIFIAYMLLVWPYAFISSYITVFVTEQKMLSAAAAVTCVSATGIGSAAGRFLGGAMVDRLGCKRTYLIMCLCSVVACLLLPAASSLGALVALFILLCIGYGGRTPVYGVIFGKQFGPKYASGIYGWGTLGTAITLFIAPMVTAALRTSSGGSFTSTCIIAAIVAAIGCASMLLVPKLNPIQRKEQ